MAPRNVFGGNIPPRPQKKSKDVAARKDKPILSKTPIIKKPATAIKPTNDVKKLSENEILIRKSKEDVKVQKNEEQSIVEEQKIEEVVEKEEQILEENILGRKTKKKTIGLQKRSKL